MRTATSALVSFLLSKEPYFQADLFTFSLLNGSVYRWTSSDKDVTYGSDTWSAAGPAIQRSGWSLKNSTEVSELSIKMFSTGTDFDLGNIKELIGNGLLDGAHVQFQRAVMPTWGDTTLGLITMWGGRVGKVDVDSLGAQISSVSYNVLMEQNVPRNTFQLGCIHTLYDAGCTLVKASFTIALTVTGSNSLTLLFTDPGITPSDYLLGTLLITSGDAAGQSRTVASVGAGTLNVAYPFHVVPAIGDTFSLTQGCDKTRDRCTRFGNLLNFRGFPYIPPATLGL